MRYIEKAAEPPLLRKWKWDNSSLPQTLRYVNIPAEVRRELRESLLNEQGFLCAYTMMRIASRDKGHIEHIRPQLGERENDIDHAHEIDYANMVYCYPGGDAPHCEFGAKHKDDFDATSDNFVSPLQRTCETRLAYDLLGSVRATSAMDAPARQTIEILNLNHAGLVAERVAAIRSQRIFRRATKPLTAAEARKLATLVVRRDGAGKIAPFCIAIKQVAERFAEQREARDAALARKPPL